MLTRLVVVTSLSRWSLPRGNARHWSGRRLPELLLGTLPGTKLRLVARPGPLCRLGALPGTVLSSSTASLRTALLLGTLRRPGTLPGTVSLLGTLPGTVLRRKAASLRSALPPCSSQSSRKLTPGMCDGDATLTSRSRNGQLTSGPCRARCASTT